MPKGFKFGEPSKLINVRVPESRHKEFREVIQKAINDYFKGNNGDFEGKFKRLYALMVQYFTPKSDIPSNIIEEIEQMEESL